MSFRNLAPVPTCQMAGIPEILGGVYSAQIEGLIQSLDPADPVQAQRVGEALKMLLASAYNVGEKRGMKAALVAAASIDSALP